MRRATETEGVSSRRSRHGREAERTARGAIKQDGPLGPDPRDGTDRHGNDEKQGRDGERHNGRRGARGRKGEVGRRRREMALRAPGRLTSFTRRERRARKVDGGGDGTPSRGASARNSGTCNAFLGIRLKRGSRRGTTAIPAPALGLSTWAQRLSQRVICPARPLNPRVSPDAAWGRPGI